MKPLTRPITSITKTRLNETIVSLILSTATTAVSTAVSKPIVSSVPKTSLSIVAGIPMILVSVSLLNPNAPLKVPFPPITTSPSRSLFANVSAAFLIPSSVLNFREREVRRIVPPVCKIPTTE